MHVQDTLERPAEREVMPVPPPWLVLAAAVVVGVTLALVVLVVAPAFNRPADVTRSQFRDGDGRVCLQLQAGRALALDCDYRPLFRGNA